MYPLPPSPFPLSLCNFLEKKGKKENTKAMFYFGLKKSTKAM
jgi:hypothetical protein